VHGGGRDLIYPHHESENLIARAHTGRDFAKVWMHNGWLTLETEKMSKSLGNVVPIRDVLAEWPAEVVRLCLAKSYYRENVEYDKDCFKRTKEEMGTIRGAIRHTRGVATAKRSNPTVSRLVERTRRTFLAAMDDDFDTNTAFYALLQFAEALRQVRRMSADDRARTLAAVRDFGRILGVSFA
ncbi:MAG: class I tRNA ligase family protein, partial [Euryarchaeota archaeon]|nr:class I tRNA ligase family protein [Euryarchaeota archaeon]